LIGGINDGFGAADDDGDNVK